MVRSNNRSLLFDVFLLFAIISVVIGRRRSEKPVESSDEIEPFDDFNCPEKFGYYADATNCSRYHICDHGKSSIKSCDDGLVFSTILKTCDWPYNVHCNIADGNRGEFVGRSLRLNSQQRQPSDDNNNEHNQISNHRRQPVLANEDDSYWLGRPETTLLALDDDDQYVEPYIDHHYEVSRNNDRQPEVRRKVSSGARNVDADNDVDSGSGPWFHSLNFDQIRRGEDRNNQQPTVFRRLENNGTTTRMQTTTIAPVTTVSTTTANPFTSANGRGGGWRQTKRQRTTTTTAKPTTTIEQQLPRKPLRTFTDDEILLTDDIDSSRIGSNNLDGDYARAVPRTKDDRDSYRLIPTTTVSRSPPTSTIAPVHLGSSRRRTNRKQTTTTTPAPPPPPTTTARSISTSRLRTWDSRIPTFQRNPETTTTIPTINLNNQRLPSDNPFKQFERRPVLRDAEDVPTRDNFEDDVDDVLDDGNYYAMPVEIRKKSHLDLPNNKVEDRSNSLDTSSRRRRPNSNNVNKPKRIDEASIYKAYQNGFRQAVPTPSGRTSPSITDDDGRSVNPSIDMEYEDVKTDDEEPEDSEDSGEDNEPNQPPSRTSKEIVVRYDDDDDEEQLPPMRRPTSESIRNTVTPKLATFSRSFVSTVPTTQSPPTTLAPRLTQFVDLVVRNPPLIHQPQTVIKPQAKIHYTDLISNQHRVAQPQSRSLLNLGLVPSFHTNQSSNPFFYHQLPPPPPPLPLSLPLISLPNHLTTPKQPRHIGQSVTPSKKPQKIKSVKKVKKIKPANRPQPKQQSFNHQSGTLLPSSAYQRAKRCIPEVCQPPNCRCGGIDIPGGFQPKEIPQLVLLTFDDSVNDLNREIYKKLFEQGRKNPNGCPIRSTFYVSHEWTDYSQVQNLYAKGHEMASHTISHSFGEKFSKERWLAEVAGQREIMHLYGGVDWHDIRGMRAPFLQTGGDTMFEMLKEANFSYDSSMPVYDIDPPYWPYTLDHSINHECMIEPCPSHSIPGLWEVGMIMWEDLRGGRCSMADGCFNPSDEEGVYQMVKANFYRHYKTNRSPFGMYFHSRWFLTEHNMKGFVRFLDEMLQMKDVYLVTNWQMIQWMQRPTPLSQIRNFAPFGCDDIRHRPPMCKAPHTCKVRFRSEQRTLRTCQSCPRQYPWTGNNGLEQDGKA